MRFDRIVVVAMLLVACGDVRGATVAPLNVTTPSLPPQRVADCVNFILLDDKCTADWYHCKRGPAPDKCVQAWQDCCTLPGQGARSKLGAPEHVSSNR